MENNLLEMNNITKEFPGVKALNNVSLTIKNGSVHALMDENGAGKSTLMKCCNGSSGIESSIETQCDGQYMARTIPQARWGYC